MSEIKRDEQSENHATDDENTVEPMYVYTGPQIIADSKTRLTKWLERRGW